MTVLFEIFDSLESMAVKDININYLLGYPNDLTFTSTYRNDPKTIIKHMAENLWAGIITDELTNACAAAGIETHAAKLPYYDDSNLKDRQYLIDNGWFPKQ